MTWGLGFLLLAGMGTGVAQSPWPVAVHDWQFGGSQTLGQSTEYFPANVLGPLASPVGPAVPASLPEQVVSLGAGGWVALSFESPIVDGPGPDFIVFENAFTYGPNNALVFEEWLQVAVSQDGTTWHTFPNDCATGTGMAGHTPTAAFGANYQDPAQSGGDAFDLQALGIDSIYHVRVTDAVACQPVDALRLAAELDGIVAVNQVRWPAASAPTQDTPPIRLYWASAQPQVLAATTPLPALQVLSATGAVLQSLPPGQRWVLQSPLPSGIYYLVPAHGAAAGLKLQVP